MKRMNLLQKLLAVVIIPLIIILVLTGMTMRDIGKIVASKIEKVNLETSNYTAQMVLSSVDRGQYQIENGELYKGYTKVANLSDRLDKLKDDTKVDVTLFFGPTRAATTIKGENGQRVVGTNISNELYSKICEEKELFDEDFVVNGQPYYGYYEVVHTFLDGTSVIVFTGVDQASISEIYSKRITSTMIFFSGLILVFSVGIGIIVKIIVASLKKTVGYLDQVSEGNLAVNVDAKLLERGDEVGIIANAINKLVDRFISIVYSLTANSKTLVSFSEDLGTTFEDIHGSVKDVNTAVEEIVTGATSQAKDANEVNDEIADMGRAVDKASAGVETLNSITKDMENSNNEVSATLRDLAQISERTQDVIQQVFNQTTETNEAAQQINGVIDMIQEIASQTNLLSLNASIEAARAGEQGKGFAVVADEVRKLAEQSEASAKQISEIVLSLITKTNEGVASMDNVMKENQLQKEKLDTTQVAFAELNKEIQKVSTEVEIINNEIKNIDSSKNAVLERINQLASVSTESVATTEETAASMERVESAVNTCTERITELDDICNNLNNNVNQFKLPKE